LFDLACDYEIMLKMGLINTTEARVPPITNNLQQVADNIQTESEQFEIPRETF